MESHDRGVSQGHRGDHDSWAQSPGEGLLAAQPTRSPVHTFLFPKMLLEEGLWESMCTA